MRFFKKALSLVLAASMLTGIAGVTALAKEKENADVFYNGTFYYRPGTGEYLPGTDSVDYFVYSDDFFKYSGKEYNAHLATLSMSLAEASVSSTREPFTPEGYANKSRNAVAFLEDNGFSDIEVNNDYRIKPTKDSMGVGCAHKTIREDDKDYTLLVIMPRNAGYEAEWGNNFVLGAEGDAAGFDGSADKCLAFTKDYVASHGISGDIKVWTMGYSRGAAAANLMAKKLIDAPNEWLGDAVTLDSDDLYAYTFGTPMAADSNNNPRDAKYAGIFNSYENTEIASAMAPSAMGFERYGTDFMIFNPDKFDAMLENLDITNHEIHDSYVSSVSSRLFKPKKIDFSDGSVSMVDDPDSYIPDDPVEYLNGTGAYLKQFVGGRENFAKTYEQPFSDLFAYYESLTGDDASAFTSTLTGHKDTLYLVAALYAYFMKSQNNDNVYMSKEIANAKAKELAALTVGADEDSSGMDASVIAKVGARLAIFLLQNPETIKKEAAQYLRNVMTDAMTASGATQQQINSVTSNKASEALVHLISYLLLGNIWQSGELHPLQINNQQMKAAATLIGNAANLFVDHANEIIMSWLRLEDSYFADYAPLTEAQLKGYRRVYIDAGEATFNGSVLDENGDIVGVIENGVLTSSADAWIGYTTCDEGGFFRIPYDKDYKIKLNTSADTAVGVRIGHYDVYEATTAMQMEGKVNASSSDTVTVSLPAPTGESTAYSVTVDRSYILGDADMDGKVTISDVTVIQMFTAEIPEEAFSEAAADVNGDGTVNVIDATLIQEFLAELPVPYPIGK